MSGTLTADKVKWASQFARVDLDGNPSGHAGGDKQKHHKESTDEKLAKMQDQLRGHTKMDIARLGGELLQKQYNDMITGLERAKKARVADIEGWKPEQAPMSGNVLLAICKGLSTVAKTAFPEVEFLEIAATGVELTIKGKEMVDRGVEASKSDLEDVQKAAKLELDKLIGGAKDRCSNQQDKFQRVVEAAADKLTSDQLDQMQGITEPAKVGGFVRDVLGISRGEDHSPGVIKQMQVEIHNAFNQWVIKEFRRRKAGATAHHVASKGGHSFESMNLHELYRLKLAGDDRSIQIMLQNLNKDLDENSAIPKGWYEKMLHKMTDELDSDVADEFGDDPNINVMELPT